ncbi:MAG: ABC transporter permease [Dehalococcoidia bacterium]
MTVREVLERVRSRSYVLATGAIALLSVALVIGTARLPDFFEEGPARIAVTADSNNTLRDAINTAARQLDVEVELSSVDDRAAGQAALEAGDVDAVVVASEREVLFEKSDNASVLAVVNQALRTTELQARLDALGLTLEQARPLIAPEPATVELLQPEEPGRTLEDGARAVTFLSTLIMYGALALYGNWVLMGVVEEKSSRVVEVLLGTVRPFELLAGKVLGILAVALSQLVAGIAGIVAGILLTGDVNIPDVSGIVLVVAALWFVLGLLFYNFAYAAVGATVSRQSDAASAAWPLVMVLIVPYMASMFLIPDNPDGLISRVLSYLPLSSPMAMPARYGAGEPALWELALSVALMLPSIAGIVWLAGRIYAGAILSSRPRVNLFEAFRSSGELSS